MFREKVVPLSDLAIILQRFKRKNKRIVQCHGCFDLVHYGHMKHFESAKMQGDFLVVTVTPDGYINKGEGRPFFTLEQRCKYLSGMELIDYVSPNEWPSSAQAIQILCPDVYVKGIEYQSMPEDSKLQLEKAAIEAVGGSIYYTDDIVFSSTKLINEGLF